MTDANFLSGSLPTEICLLDSLEKFYVNNNNLVGTLPSCLVKLPKLVELDVANNRFTGSLPSGLFMTKLESLILSYNQFTGSLGALFKGLPASGGTYTAINTLQVLSLDNNKFSGSVPSKFFFMSKLHDLTLQGNDLTGTVSPVCPNGLTTLTVDCSKVSCSCCTRCY